MLKTDEKQYLRIGNDFICREFSIERKRITTTAIVNHISGRTMVPMENSEEFSIHFAGFPKRVIECSELKISKIDSSSENGIDTVQIEFKPVKVKGCLLTVVCRFILGENDSFMRKQLLIHTHGTENTPIIDHISFDNIIVDPLLTCSQIPVQQNTIIPGFQMQLGQPIYVDSLFFGCEFPCSLNTIEDGKLNLNYYSGKALSSLCENGIYYSKTCVCGCAASAKEVDLTQAFFAYIDVIALPCKIRKQYNSWYDHMLDITPENLISSFREIEKGCTKFGLKPLDAYVADDGWNDYQADFWSFNQKFPNELYDVANFCRSLGSTFGLWIGPRGGYNKDTFSFAKRIQAAGKGHYNRHSRDICVADVEYLQNLEAWMKNCDERFDLSYWKVDGFSSKPCTNKSHGHAVGGKNNMYYYTDLCEKWLHLFTTLRAEREMQGKSLFINATCYCNPSAWYLPYVNTIWLQNSSDIGFLDTGKGGEKFCGNDKDKVLSYRDNCYYDFYRTRKLRFPPSHLYNHDPIFGHNAKVSYSSSDFFQLLLMNACRGTSFFELYYSYDLMDDKKWAINAAVLQWAEDNQDVLSRSLMIGNSPKSGKIYGYSCWKEENGIIALRNPGNEPLSYTLSFDDKIGVKESVQKVACTDMLTGTICGEISYKSSMEVHIAAHEIAVFTFGQKIQPLTCRI